MKAVNFSEKNTFTFRNLSPNLFFKLKPPLAIHFPTFVGIVDAAPKTFLVLLWTRHWPISHIFERREAFLQKRVPHEGKWVVVSLCQAWWSSLIGHQFQITRGKWFANNFVCCARAFSSRKISLCWLFDILGYFDAQHGSIRATCCW